MSTIARGAVAVGLATAMIGGCSQNRYSSSPPPVYDTDVAPILQSRCAACHSGASPQGGWSVDSYLQTIACVAPSGAAATLPSNQTAPILAALSRSPHISILSGQERTTLEAWVGNGAPAFVGTVHSPGIVDPRSPNWHGTMLRNQHWAPMLDPNDANACGRCHAGSPTPIANVTLGAPGATACTTCHDQPQGALACSTCHGNGTRAYPPRDLCFFSADSSAGVAHAAHVEPSSTNPSGLPCSTCHPAVGAPVMGGTHGNGVVEVAFDPQRVTPEASYDPSTKQCAVTCHNRGGARPKPLWSETTPMACNSCHASPPANHFPGACTNCHAEANAAGTALSGGPLHMNGKVDLGDGSGKCGACHGTGDSPWPLTGAHPSHQNPSIAASVPCSSCHVVPQTILDPVHLDGTVHVTFAGLAIARGASPVWNGASCSETACHGAKLPDVPAVVPNWLDTSGAASKCGACHGLPPSQHTTSTSCSRSTCHGTETSEDGLGGSTITTSGKISHINGMIDFVQ